jgi:phage/conjugal plasmid C-4 type zinc finger TraR family protein
MSDICDQADDVIEETRNRALAQIPSYTGISATECVECGEGIPAGRRVAIPGVQLCTPCAEREALVRGGVRRG